MPGVNQPGFESLRPPQAIENRRPVLGKESLDVRLPVRGDQIAGEQDAFLQP